MINIVIVDDHILTREGLKSHISKNTSNMQVIGEAADSIELMNILSKRLPDVVVLDISIPGRNGIDTLKHIKKYYPKIKVLILTIHPEERYAVRAFKAGAVGYFLKDEKNLLSELVKAIRVVAIQNRKYISSSVASKLADFVDNNNLPQGHETLSDREYEVLLLIASGKTIRTIAGELSLAIQTVHTYRNRLREKLQLSSNTELIKYALRNRLID